MILYQNGRNQLTYPGSRSVSGSAINDAGKVVGTIFKSSDVLDTGAFVLSNGTFQLIKSPFGKGMVALGINNSGKVVGSVLDGRSEFSQLPYIYENGDVRLLPLPALALGEHARQINDFDEIVGTAQFEDASRPIYWKNGVVTDLTTAANRVLVSNRGMDRSTPISNATGINNLRQIVVRTRDGDAQRSALLSPVIGLTCQGITNGLVTLEISGLPARLHVIESARTLSGPWNQRTNFVLHAEQFAFALARSEDEQFYRAYATRP